MINFMFHLLLMSFSSSLLSFSPSFLLLKSIVGTMLQSFVCMGLVSALWVIVGFSLTYGESIHGIIGSPFTFFFLGNVGAAPCLLLAPTVPLSVYTMYQMTFAIITPALISGHYKISSDLELSNFTLLIMYLRLYSHFTT